MLGGPGWRGLRSRWGAPRWPTRGPRPGWWRSWPGRGTWSNRRRGLQGSRGVRCKGKILKLLEAQLGKLRQKHPRLFLEDLVTSGQWQDRVSHKTQFLFETLLPVLTGGLNIPKLATDSHLGSLQGQHGSSPFPELGIDSAPDSSAVTNFSKFPHAGSYCPDDVFRECHCARSTLWGEDYRPITGAQPLQDGVQHLLPLGRLHHPGHDIYDGKDRPMV